MIKPIYLYNSKILRVKAKPVQSYENIDSIITDMYDTMLNARAIGLAAPQIGISKQIIVFNYNELKTAFINPVISDYSELKQVAEEGCLSIPQIYDNVQRSKSIKVSWLDSEWNEHVEVFSDFTAQVIQHEYDHLNGILFTDKLSPDDRLRYYMALRNIKLNQLYPTIK